MSDRGNVDQLQVKANPNESDQVNVQFVKIHPVTKKTN